MIFVTGGTGLIGSHLLYKLVSDGKSVKALRREKSNLQQVFKVFSWYSSNAEALFSRINWVNGDIQNYFDMEMLLEGIEEVYHCAGIVSFDSREHRKMIHNNVEGTANLVNAALENGVKKFCHVSSVSALGKNENGYHVNEDTNWIPSKKNSAYSKSKFFSEAEVWRGIEEGMDAVIVNPSIVLGPGNWDTGSPGLFKLVWKGMKFYSGGSTGYVDVKDVVKAMVMLMDNRHFETFKNNRYLLNAENRSFREMFNLIADELNRPRPSFYAGNLMLGFTWRAMAAIQLFIKTERPVTREVASAAGSKVFFDGSKITAVPGFSYLPVAESVKQTSAIFKSDMNISGQEPAPGKFSNIAVLLSQSGQ
jgi:dihydroflavonol-4-reductase